MEPFWIEVGPRKEHQVATAGGQGEGQWDARDTVKRVSCGFDVSNPFFATVGSTNCRAGNLKR